MRKVIVIALGGNAIKQADEKGTAEEQRANVATTCTQLVSMLKYGHRLVITHGNGPQAGNLLIQQESGVAEVPAQPLDIEERFLQQDQLRLDLHVEALGGREQTDEELTEGNVF